MAEHPINCDGGWIECRECNGECDFHDCGEDSCCCLDPIMSDRRICHNCRGTGGHPCPVCEGERL